MGLLNWFRNKLSPHKSSSASTGVPAWQERAPRVRITTHHDRAVFYTDSSPTVALAVGNLSRTGVGLLLNVGQTKPFQGSVAGHLKLGERRVPVTLSVVREGTGFLGCRIEGGDTGLGDLIRELFSVEVAAVGLDQVNPAFLKKEDAGDPHWFRSDSSELYYKTEGGRVTTFHLSYAGGYLEGGVGQPTRFGVVDRGKFRGKPGYKEAEIVRWQDATAADLQAARRFIGNIEGLPAGDQQQILAMADRIQLTA